MRDVPAVFTWLGGLGTGSDPNDAGDAANWSAPGLIGYLPTSDDSIVIDQRMVSSGGLMMSPPVPTSFDCDGLSGTFEAMTINPDYIGIVTLSGALEVGGFDMENGTIDQPTTGTDITVHAEFNWTNGTINSTSNVATVSILDSTTAAIEPDGGTLYLGSNLSIEDGTVLTMGEGTVEVTNEELEFAIGAYCGVAVDPGEDQELKLLASPGVAAKPNLSLVTNSWLEVQSGKYTVGGSGSNNGGRVTLFPNTTAEFLGPNPNGPAYLQGSSSSGGITELFAGSMLKTAGTEEVWLLSGKLSTRADGASCDATIDTKLLVVAGSEIVIGDGSVPHTYGTLYVDGDVLWTAGVYRPVVLGEESGGPADLWYASGTFTVGGIAFLAPGSLDYENSEVVPPESNMRWLVIEADGGISIQANNNPPGVTGPFSLDPGAGAPPTEWYVKS